MSARPNKHTVIYQGQNTNDILMVKADAAIFKQFNILLTPTKI
ncbi:hypothetical protein SAMN04488121_109108 [Chitinophaga filiformis]|uniref:Uncharacterized protein n=1 Tax=Chitinophaga filiformis TaxID=104663 RepID=A0A1G8A3N2_CHIFI|nr:hypothetical protein SAMN04488121_109108 [Chitinophaga filiformis]